MKNEEYLEDFCNEPSFIDLLTLNEDCEVKIKLLSFKQIINSFQSSARAKSLCNISALHSIEKERLYKSTGKVRYELKTPYNDGTTHVFFEPLDFIAKLAARVPPPGLNINVRFHWL
jgi:hypothetical protein